MVSSGSSSTSGSSDSRNTGTFGGNGNRSCSTLDAVAGGGPRDINQTQPIISDDGGASALLTWEDTSMQGRRHAPQASAPPTISRPSRSGDAKALPPVPPSSSSNPGGMFRKLTTKLRPSTVPSAGSDAAAPQPEISRPTRKTTMRLPTMPRVPQHNTTKNDFTSHEQRQAALRARGLIPTASHPYKDSNGYMIPLSEQERVLDEKRAVVVAVPTDASPDGSESEAKRIREAWLAKNRTASEPQPEQGTLKPHFVFPADAGAKGGAVEVDSYSVVTSVPSDFRVAAEVSAMLEKEEGMSSASMTVLVQSARPSPGPVVPDSDAVPTSPASPSNESSDMSHMVSRWMDESSKLPSNCSGPIAGITQVVTTSYPAAPSSPPTTAVAPPPPSKSPPLPADSPRTPVAAPSNAPHQQCPDSPTLGLSPAPEPSSRGRSASVSQACSDNSHSSGAGLGARRGRHAAVPALSPTRTTSSSGASASVQTPTTAENHTRARSRPPDLRRADAPAILESPVEHDEQRSVEDGGERRRMTSPPEFTLTMDKERRRSFTQAMFGKRPVEQPAPPPPPEPQPRTPSGFSLRKLSSKLQIKTKPLPAPPSAGDAATDTRPLSAHAGAPPSAFPGRLMIRTPGVGPRARSRSRSREPATSPRQVLAPQIHDHQSLVVEAGRIKDEESRRLSEMAFLDY